MILSLSKNQAVCSVFPVKPSQIASKRVSAKIILRASQFTVRHIGLQFEKRMTEKTYIARVWGQVKNDKGEIDLPLITDWPNRPRQMVCHERGKPSLTEWQVLERKENTTRVKLYPKTGRSHQLRVHMLAIGHVILGDRLYADEEAFLAAPRLQLHAHKLKLRKPTGGEWAEFISPCPF